MPRLAEPKADSDSAPEPLRRMPWWLWPHLWSLDAPVVAVTWQTWWSRVAHVEPLWQHALILGGAVWMIYLADRLADVSRADHAEHGTARHAFYRGRRRGALAGVLGLAAGLGVVTLRWLSAGEFHAGLGMLALAGSYFWLTHRRRRPAWTALFPKEAAVGGLFTLGTMFFVWGRAGQGGGSLSLGSLFAASLFFLNCAFITRWESSERDRQDPTALRNAFPGVIRRLGASAVGLAIAAAGLSIATGTIVLLPIAAGAALLFLLDRCRTQLSVDALRILADVVLLVPWCFLLLQTRF